ncbi:MAG: ATP synthase subunit I [Polaromonas sp.]
MVTIPTQNQADQAQQTGRGPKGHASDSTDRWIADGLNDGSEAEEESFKPLTRSEVERIRAANPPASVMRVVGVQVLASVVVAGLARVLTGQDAMGWSALYGGLAVWIPAALFARGLQRQKASGHAGSALMGFFVWELVKIVLTVAMLLAAPRLVSQLNWLALLAGFVVTMKVYWLAMWLHLVRTNSVSKAVDQTAQKNG